MQRADSVTLEASGKGVNVSRALRAAGVRTCAVAPVAGATGRHLVELLARDGVPHLSVDQDGSTRVNTSALHPGGVTLKLNGPGNALSPAQQNALVERAAAAIDEALVAVEGRADDVWLAVCGSLPPDVRPDIVRRLIAVAREAGVRCAVDASGDALAAALDEPAHLLAPNRVELGEVSPDVRAAPPGVEGLARAAARLARRRDVELLVSLGASGALWTDGRRTLHAVGPALTPVNTAGAGDALLAGWLAGTDPPEQRLARAVRWGRSACLSATTVDPHPGAGDVAHIRVQSLGSPHPSVREDHQS